MHLFPEYSAALPTVLLINLTAICFAYNRAHVHSLSIRTAVISVDRFQ